MKNYDISFYQLFDDAIDNTDGNIFVTTDYYGNKVIENKLSRYHVGDLMKRNCTDLVITDKDLETFNSEFTYLFDGFTAFSDSDTPLTDCIRQFNQLHVPSSEHYLVKIWTAPEYKISAKQLREFRRWLIVMPDEEDPDDPNAIYSLKAGIGNDENLTRTQVRVDIVEYYNEMCWPPRFWYNWIACCKEDSLDDVMKFHKELPVIIQNQIEPEYRDEVYTHTVGSGLLNMKYSDKRSWDETLKVLEYLSKLEEDYKCMAHEYARNISYCDKFDEFIFSINLLKWCIGKGAYLNIINVGVTLLDLLYDIQEEGTRYNRDWLAQSDFSYKDYIQEVIDYAISHGAKTLKNIFAEEDLHEPEYEREVELLKEYCSIYHYE